MQFRWDHQLQEEQLSSEPQKCSLLSQKVLQVPPTMTLREALRREQKEGACAYCKQDPET